MPDLSLEAYISTAELTRLIGIALDEDLGPDRRDITSELMIEPDQQGQAVFRSRQAGRLCGMAILPALAEAIDDALKFEPALKLEPTLNDGAEIAAGDKLATLAGPMRGILAMERIALNLLTHLSGIASQTSLYVTAVEQSLSQTQAKICDTRKTLPGLRALEKYAVAAGGGVNHRIGLYDAVLIKDNHLAHIPADQLATKLTEAVNHARHRSPKPAFVEIEVDTLEQLRIVLAAKPDIVLLDNMNPGQLLEAVMIRDRQGEGVLLEASGNITLETVAVVAGTGVDRIAVGAITHSAPALDIGLDIT